MELTRLEREGAVKLTADPLLIEHFKELGYKVVGGEEETVPETTATKPETAPEVGSPFEKMTKDELVAFIAEKGANAPSSATKDILIDIAKTLEV